MNDPRRAIERMFAEVLNENRMEVLDEILTPDHVEHSPFGDLHGPEAYRQFLVAWRHAVPDQHATLSDVVVEGDRAAWRYRFTGTHTGPLFGLPPTGRRIDISGVNMARFRDGRAAEHWTGNELFQLFGQLGLLPPPFAMPA
jgi:predicted ester cyclase